MKEPLRLLNDANTPASMRRALSASTGVPPLPLQIRSAMSDVAAQLASTAGTMGSAMAGKSTIVLLEWMTSKAAVKTLVVVASLGVASGVAWVAEPLVLRAVTAQKSPAMVAPPAANRITPPVEVVSQPAAPVSSRVADPRPARVPRTTELRPTATSETTSESPPANQSKIAQEAKLLERARSHLASNPALALAETNQHLQEFGEGQMGAERELIAVEALLRLGRRSEAEGRAAPRLRLDPSGLYAKRLRQIFTEF